MREKNIVTVIMICLAVVFVLASTCEGADSDLLPLPGVATSVYGATTLDKPDIKKASAFQKYIEIDFSRNARGTNDTNYLLYLDNDGSTDTLTCSTYVFGFFVRDTINNPGISPGANDDFAQYNDSSPGSTNWIVKPLSHVFTVLPMLDAEEVAGYDLDDEGGIIDEIDQYELYWPAVITLKYDKTISDPYGTVTVLYRQSDRSPWEILPGLVNTSSGTVTTVFARNGFGTYCVVNLDGNFNEFPATGGGAVSWSQQYVTGLWTKGILSQTKQDGYFGLIEDDTEYKATRGEFAAMLVKGMRLPIRTELTRRLFNEDYNNFDDVSSGDNLLADGIDYADYYPLWVDYAYASAKYGLFNGFREGDVLVFKPEDYVTREQAAALIARAAKLKVENLEAEDASFTKDEKGNYIGVICKGLKSLKYTDADIESISPWALPYVYAVSKAKYMEGYPEDPADSKNKNRLFNASEEITRAQTAKLVYKLLSTMKLI